MPTTASPVRWGILGTAEISRKNWRAILNSGNGVITALASRDAGKARSFVDEQQKLCPFPQVPVACGSYEELLARSDVDAVYCPLPTAVRQPWLLKVAAAGKHVLSEKPCGVNAAELEEVLAACRKRNLQYMDGVMFMHSARLPEMRKVLDDGSSVGAIRRITSQFSFLGGDDFLPNNIRTKPELEPHGVLGDLGWYCIRFSLWALNGKLPRSVSGRQLEGAGTTPDGLGAPLEFSGELFFEGGVSASFHCSFLKGFAQWMHVSGIQGALQLNDFVLPQHGSQLKFEVVQDEFQIAGGSFQLHGKSKTYTVTEDGDGTPNAQEAKMFREFGRLVQSGKTDLRWGEWSLKTQQVLDACRKSAADGGRVVEL